MSASVLLGSLHNDLAAFEMDRRASPLAGNRDIGSGSHLHHRAIEQADDCRRSLGGADLVAISDPISGWNRMYILTVDRIQGAVDRLHFGSNRMLPGKQPIQESESGKDHRRNCNRGHGPTPSEPTPGHDLPDPQPLAVSGALQDVTARNAGMHVIFKQQRSRW